MDWFEIKNSAQVLTPALLFYPDRIKSNIEQMIQIAGTADRLRPHVKTYKCPEIVRMQLDKSISKFKCSTLSEASMLAECGVSDVLVAYPLIGPAQEKFIQLSNQFPNTHFSVLADHPAQLDQWKKITNKPINIFVDLDVGMHRTGTSPELALELIQDFGEQFQLQGLHVYDGHIHTKDLTSRAQAIEQAFEPIHKLIDPIDQAGIEVVCGGSASFPIHAKHSPRTLSPGTTLLWDHGYQTNFPDMQFDIAAAVMTRVVSKPKPHLICLDVGHKAVASEMSEPSLFFPQLPNAKIITLSEEHMVLEIPNSKEWEIGAILYAIPQHICPTVALHEQAGVVTNYDLKDYWKIQARNRTYTL